jgi:hypothetical protein
MRRKLPNVTIPSWKEPDKRTKWTLQLKVITPICGGGSQEIAAGEVTGIKVMGG